MSIWNKPGIGFAIVSLALSSCGYHIAGKQNLIPKTVHSIAIPPFENATVHYKLTDVLPQDIGRELISRTKYQIISDPTQADAVLTGTVINYVAFPTLIDQATGRTSGLQVIVRLGVSLTERTSGKLIYNRPYYEAHERYEASVTNNYQYFDESGVAVQRLSKDVARDVVSSILEDF
ncbi:MAG TPA: LptE family protein [Bryobacteraceae bacterium]|nr:LptE family protein [Bryobacteraceae bacterium]